MLPRTKETARTSSRSFLEEAVRQHELGRELSVLKTTPVTTTKTAPLIESYEKRVKALDMNDQAARQRLSADASAQFDDIMKNRMSDVA